jgi:hypothetical protein
MVDIQKEYDDYDDGCYVMMVGAVAYEVEMVK